MVSLFGCWRQQVRPRYAGSLRGPPLAASASANTVQGGIRRLWLCRHWASLLQGRMHAGDRHRWSVKPPFGSTRRHVCSTDEDRIWPTQFPRRSSSCLERASNSSPLIHHFSWTVQSWVEDLPLQPGVLHRQPLGTFVEECIDLLTYFIFTILTLTCVWRMQSDNHRGSAIRVASRRRAWDCRPSQWRRTGVEGARASCVGRRRSRNARRTLCRCVTHTHTHTHTFFAQTSKMTCFSCFFFKYIPLLKDTCQTTQCAFKRIQVRYKSL